MEYNILMKVQTIKYLQQKMCLKNLLLLTERQLKVALRKNTNLENLAKNYLPQWQNLYFLLLPYVLVLRKILLHMVLNLLVKDSVRFLSCTVHTKFYELTKKKLILWGNQDNLIMLTFHEKRIGGVNTRDMSLIETCFWSRLYGI